MTTEQTYVYHDTAGSVEVRPTGRTAETKLRSGKVDVLNEVTPVEPSLGTWKKWVQLDKLPKVVQ